MPLFQPFLGHLRRRRTALDLIIRCLQNRSGATVIEYVFIASIVSIAAIAGMQLIGNELSSIFTTVANDL